MRTELQTLMATNLQNLDGFELQSPLMQGAEETLAKAVNMSIRAANTGIKYAFFRFIEIALTDMAHHWSMDEVVHERFERWTQSEALVSRSAEEAFKHRNFTERVPEITNFNVAKEVLVG